MRSAVKRILLGCAAALSVAAPALAQTQVESARLTVDFTQPGPIVEPEVYGQFVEHVGRGVYDGIWVGDKSPIPNIHGYRRDVVLALKDLQVPLLRWPGGCFADQYDWRDGIGPRSKRPVRVVRFYGGQIETNQFGTNEFLDFSELIGAKPYIALNMGSMTPLDSVRWLEYMTGSQASALTDERRANGRDRPWDVKYIGLGNETMGCGGAMLPEDAANRTRLYASFANGGRSDSRKFFKVAGGPIYKFPGYEEFTDAMMKNRTFGADGNDTFQALSFHFYATQFEKSQTTLAGDLMPAVGFTEKQWAQLLENALQINDGLSVVSHIMDRYDPEKKVAIAVDEWGVFHAPASGTTSDDHYYQMSLVDAEVAIIMLNSFARHTDRVKLANDSMMVNTLNALILTKGNEMVLTPIYHVFTMLKPFKGATPYPAQVAAGFYRYEGVAIPRLDVAVVKGTDQKIHLSIANLDPRTSVELITNVPGRPTGLILTGAELDAHNEFGTAPAVTPKVFKGRIGADGKAVLTIPPKSIVVVQLD